MVGITAIGGYIPRMRLSRKAIATTNAWIQPNLVGKGRGERSMANWDEDAITMGVEAARDCLNGDGAAVDSVYFASVSMPFADRQNAGLIATALNLNEDIFSADVSASHRASTAALIQAMTGVKAGESKHGLVIAGEHRKTLAASSQELDFGDAAAAVTVGDDNVIAKLVGHHTLTIDFVDHFRGAEEEVDYNWEERWIRDEGYSKIVPRAIGALLEKTGVKAEEIDHFIMPTTFARLDQAIARRCGIDPENVRDNLAAVCGDSGTAHAIVMLVHCLQEAKAGEKILVANFAMGCDALLFEVTDAISSINDRRGIAGSLAERKEETNYMKLLYFNNLVDWEKGMRAEPDKKTALTTLYRKRDMIEGLVGGKCTKCGTAQFPRTRVCVNPNCHEVDSQEPYNFADKKARILSWSADFLSFSLNPPNHYGMVTFDEGGRFMADITDVEPGTVESGMDVRMVFRIKDFDERRGFRRYFWKATPVGGAA